MKQRSNLLIFDATPLIYLAKTEVLEKISLFRTENIIVESIYKEVVETGKKKGHDDAFPIQKLIDKNIFIIKKCPEKIFAFHQNKNLSFVDKDILTFSKLNNGILITDDEEARAVAEIEGIEVHGSVYLLLKLFNKKIINKNAFKKILDMMIESGWYCSVDFYKEIINILEKEN